MDRAAFVLAGGQSRRMGRDKAMLPLAGKSLVEHMASIAKEAAGSAAIVGDPAKYGYTGFSVVTDLRPGCGPLSGIHTALTVSHAAWNLILACDMPQVSPAFLLSLVNRALAGSCDCVIPAGPSGKPEPLCAVYHLRSLPAISRALDSKVYKIMEAVKDLRLDIWQIPESSCFQNVNTPQDWACYVNG